MYELTFFNKVLFLQYISLQFVYVPSLIKGLYVEST